MKKENSIDVEVRIDPIIIDFTRGIGYTKPNFFERIKMFFGWKFKSKKIKQKSLMDLVPKVKAPKLEGRIGEILKTLKDLEIIAGEARYKSIDGITPQRLGIIEIESLRQEAIKWVKYLLDKRGLGGSGAYDVEWIKQFFNIKEEDLK